MPNRILRDGILSSEPVCSLSWPEEVFYRRLMSAADDHGRFHALPKLLRSSLYPLQIDKVSDADIGKWLTACVTAGLVSVYPASDGKRYIQIEKFGQQVRSKSKFPEPLPPIAAPPPAADISCNQLPADAHLDGGGGEGVFGDEVGVGGAPRVRTHDARRAPPEAATAAARVCMLLKQAGIAPVNPSNQLLLTLIDAGATDEEFLAAVPAAKGKKDPFKYLLGTVKGMREDAAQAAKGIHRGPMPEAQETPRERRAREQVEEAAGSYAHHIAKPAPGARDPLTIDDDEVIHVPRHAITDDR